MKILVTLLLVTAMVSSLGFQRRQIYGRDETFTLKQEQYFFSQIIDHYNYQTSNTWLQRYFVYDAHFNPKTGPVILYICG